MFVRTLCLLAAFTWFSHAGAAEGDTVLAANAILLNFQTFMAFGLDGFANAAEALVGHALGSRDRRGFDQAVRVSTLWALVTAMGFALAYALAGPMIVAGLTSNAAIRTTALHYLPWAVVSPLISVWGFQLDGIFIGATRADDLRRCMMVALAAFLPAAMILQSVYGNAGLWAALLGFMALRGIGLAVLLPRIGRGIVEA
jgi:MATE family multidrug resistance protein